MAEGTRENQNRATDDGPDPGECLYCGRTAPPEITDADLQSVWNAQFVGLGAPQRESIKAAIAAVVARHLTLNIKQIRLLRIEEGDVFVVFVPERHIQEVDRFEGVTKRLREGLKQLTGRDVPVLVLPDTFKIATVDASEAAAAISRTLDKLEEEGSSDDTVE